MRKGLVTAAATIVAIAFGGASLAQTTPPGTDRPGGETSTQSAKPKMQRTKPKTVKAKKRPKTTGRRASPTPPGTDRPSGESGATSAKPRPQ
jgi:hypothetical protein